MKITLIGAGYVGLVTGVCFAKQNNDVTLVDISKEKVELINAKKPPIYEENLLEMLKENKITATTDYKEAILNSEIIFICVGTPTKPDCSQDLSFVKSAIKDISKYLKKDQIIVIKSSVVPSTTKHIIIPYFEKLSKLKEGKDFYIAVNPEFLREGKAVFDFLNPDRIVIGTNCKFVKKKMKNLYKDFHCPIIFTNITTAEMIKYASNAFLSTKISFINEIGNICKKLGIDVYDVADGIGYDERIGRKFLNAGAGYGGSCFPKDVKALINKSKELNIKPRILESVEELNQNQPLILIDLLKKHIKNLNDKTIGILGGAFKPDTDDIRESRAITLIEKLIEEKAKIKLFDPKAMDNLKKLFPKINYTTAEDALESDAIIIITEWSEFEKMDYTGKIVIDARKIQKAQKQSTIYEGICW